MAVAEVLVLLTVPRDLRLHYAVPPTLTVEPGHLVVVPLGPRRVQGVVWQVDPAAADADLRPILSLVYPRPVLTALQRRLATEVAAASCAPLSTVVRLMVPPALRQRGTVVLRLARAPAAPLAPEEQRVAEAVQAARQVSYRQLRARLPLPRLERVVERLVRRGVLVREYTLPSPRLSGRVERYLVLARTEPWPSGSPRQAAVLQYLQTAQAAGRTEVPLEEVRVQTGASGAVLRTLIARGYLQLVSREVWPRPAVLAGREPLSGTLTAEQAAAVQAIAAAVAAGQPTVFLLHGVTGSGKTLVYLAAIAAVVRQGRRVLVLVPEIALTPQTVHRFGAHFPGQVALLHSGLRPLVHFAEWQRVRDGQAPIVIGPRSAVLAPLDNLGLIIVDEEHDPSYKAADPPRYHAREVAVALGRLAGAPVVLGSATPDVVSYYRAESGSYRLLRLPERVGPAGQVQGLPVVEVVDMRAERRRGETGLFSARLRAAIAETLERGEQALLFLNRRGAGSFVFCPRCGHSVRCRRCDLGLTYHATLDALLCHLCHGRWPLPPLCPQCQRGPLRILGVGTQRVEQEVRALFPAARVARWDRDALSGGTDEAELLRRVREHEVDIVVGTQMVAKGLHLPGITLVGVVLADIALHLPDLWAAERTFQLLTQVAGRAGRGRPPGRVVLQTYQPEHYAIRAASQHAYHLFYTQEVAFRRAHAYPPFSRLARLICVHTSERAARTAAERLAGRLRAEIARRGLPATSVLGPAPAYYRRVRGLYRWQVVVRGPALADWLGEIPLPPGCALDLDPVTLV
jgi:primosomal protein N' (replication factor Y)